MESALAERTCSRQTLAFFWSWTALFWGGVGVCAALFYVRVLDFPTSTKTGLYGISIWLNACLLVFLLPSNRGRDRLAVVHDALVVWMLSYALTNALWEIPWVLSSPFLFEGIETLEDVVANTAWMRESPVHMLWWVMASFSAVDLRTVNHDPTFYTLELYAFVNVASVIWFFKLNRERSPYRYLLVLLASGEPVASTFIFSMTEVVGAFENMPGGVADTLLALVWTQYQYFLFPLVFGGLASRLLWDDWRRAAVGEQSAEALAA